MISINRNYGSLVARLNSLASEHARETSINRMSSGLRINAAADDAAGLAVASKMDSQILGMSTALNNSMDAISAIETASAGLAATLEIAQRVRELAVQNANGTFSVTDRAAAQLEVVALNAELLRVANDTNFNANPLLDGTLDTTMQIGNLAIETLDLEITGIETITPIAQSANATGSSSTVLRPNVTGTATSLFDIPASSRATGTSLLDYLNAATATASSVFDTPSESTASGSSSLDVPATNSTVTSLTSTSGGSSLGYGSSSRSILSTNTATTTSSALDYLAASTVASGTPAPSSTTTGIPASSTAAVAAGGASVLDSLNFARGSFDAGWDVERTQIQLGSGGGVASTLGGFATPTDTEPAGSVGDGTTATPAVSLGNSSVDFNNTATATSMTLSTNEMVVPSKGISHGPAIISQDPISLNSGDIVSFDWQATGAGGDYTDVYAYLLNVNDGSTIEMLDFTTSSNGAYVSPTISTTLGAGIDGFYKFVFISGAYDNDGGGIVGSEVIVSNIGVTDTGGDSKTSTASSTIEAQESSSVAIDRSLMASLDTAVTNDSGTGTYALSGTDASNFTIDANGDITSSALLRSTQTSYSFDVTYTRSDGGYHQEAVTLNLTPALFATTTATAQESNAVTIDLVDMSELQAYASANAGGTYSIAATGSDYTNFAINASTGDITSTALDYDVSSVYNFDVLYTVGGNVFTNSMVLNLTDTLTSTTSITAEETDQLTINYADLAGTQDFVSRNPGGIFSVTGDFTLDVGNNLVSSNGMYLAEGASRTASLVYTVGGVTHTDTISIALSEALQATSNVRVEDGYPALITPSTTALSKVYAFGQADSNAGVWRLESNATDPSDYLEFSINSSTGAVTSNANLNYLVEDRFDFDVVYRASDGTEFTETVVLTVSDPTAFSLTQMTAEETDALTIAASNFTNTASFVSGNGSGGTYSLTGTNASLFDISSSGVVSTKAGVSLRLGSTDVYNYSDTYSFNVLYTLGSSVSSEEVQLTITETLASTQTVTAAESGSVEVYPTDYITDFAGRDRNNGTYSLSSSGGDNALFSVDSAGVISSLAALDYDTQGSYSFDLNYLASDGRSFVESITLGLLDTLTSTATITNEETESLTIPISQLTSSNAYQTAKPGGSFSLSGTDISYFDVNSVTGEITTKAAQSLLISDKSTYSVNLDYLDTFGVTHSEVITINLTEALQGTSTFTAAEANSVLIYVDDLTRIRSFASRDGNNGTFAIGGTDGGSLSINSDGNIESNGALDYSVKPSYNFTLSYTEAAASGGDVFTDTITLNLSDTLTSTATITVEEAALLDLAASEFSSTASYAVANPGGSYSITGTDAASFTVAANGDVTGTDIRYATKNPYSFNLLYTAGGITHTEAVTVNLTASTYGISTTTVSVTEAEQIIVANNIMSGLNSFASADGYAGSFALAAATSGNVADYLKFEVDASGSVQNVASYFVDFDNGQTAFDMDLIYTHSDGVQTYSDRLHIDLVNDFSDDTNLVLASVDISTAAGATEAMGTIASVVKRMSRTVTILGAKRNQLESNIKRLTGVRLQTVVARGRIVNADFAGEATILAKQQILSGAATQVLQTAIKAKRGLLMLLD